MNTDRKKPGWVFWMTAALVVLLAYPLSFGPACWWLSRRQPPLSALPEAPRFYLAIGWAARKGPNSLRRVISWYATLQGPDVVVPDGRGGQWMQKHGTPDVVE